MIFLPVSPASPIGPPITKLPQGLMWKTVLSSRYCLGIVVLTTFSIISALRHSKVTFSECWTETTTVWTLTGMMAPFTSRTSQVTCVLLSGLAHQSPPLRLRKGHLGMPQGRYYGEGREHNNPH